MNDEALTKDWSDLLWQIDVSIRYHTRRAAYFGNLHKATALIGLLSGTAAVAAASEAFKEYLPPSVTIPAILVIAVANAIDLLVGFSAMEAKHFGLRNAFIGARDCMVCAANRETHDQTKKQVLRIEQDEPAIYQALHLDVYNETLLATKPIEVAKAKRQPINLLQYLTRHIYRWQGI